MREVNDEQAWADELQERLRDWTETMSAIDGSLVDLWSDYRLIQASAARLRGETVDPEPQTARLIRKIALGLSWIRDGR